ncbi:MAG: M28 family peptidase [Pseudomonadota bacterium]|nr:M28 family peptidase [Pseudomonadota bacterium]
MSVRSLLILALALGYGAGAAAQDLSDTPPLLQPAHARAIANEISGSAAKRTIQELSLHHRMRGSTGFGNAAALIRRELARHGLDQVDLISLPADGNVFYGTQRSRPGWNASFAELWEQKQEGGRWTDNVRIASWADQPIVLAQDSVSGRAEAELVDIGAGTSPADYAGKELSGKLLLTSSQPEAVADMAIGQHKAAGIISWAQNQRQAWWGEDQTLIRWGHLKTFGEHPTFAFMVSPGRARAWQERLMRGEAVRLRAEVQAKREPSAYLIPTAAIPGRDKSKEIVFSCHLDHPSPGANDNASGCSAILEIARSLNRLVKEGALPQPQRTIRFIWPCEIECTIALLNARPEYARRTLATIHLDMVGGDTQITKSILRVYGSPPSLPSFVSDVGFAFGRYVNDQSLAFAGSGQAAMPLVDPEGDRRALQAEVGGFNQGSDHQVWTEGSWRIPAIYIADWPDRYIHTQRDLPANVDPTKLKRAIFIGAASAWYLANLDASGVPSLSRKLRAGSLDRAAGTTRRVDALRQAGADEADLANIWRHHFDHEAAVVDSIGRFTTVPSVVLGEANRTQQALRNSLGTQSAPSRPAGANSTVYRRVAALKGPMDGFGYSWLDDNLAKAGLERPALLARRPAGEGPGLGYEALNLVDGRRTVQQIRDDLAATIAPVPIEEVAAYLETLARLGVTEPARR